jgi:hypothetical protein
VQGGGAWRGHSGGWNSRFRAPLLLAPARLLRSAPTPLADSPFVHAPPKTEARGGADWRMICLCCIVSLSASGCCPSLARSLVAAVPLRCSLRFCRSHASQGQEDEAHSGGAQRKDCGAQTEGSDGLTISDGALHHAAQIGHDASVAMLRCRAVPRRRPLTFWFRCIVRVFRWW